MHASVSRFVSILILRLILKLIYYKTILLIRLFFSPSFVVFPLRVYKPYGDSDPVIPNLVLRH